MEVVINFNQEYRFEVGETQKFKIMVLSGLAEIKGQELLNEKWYTFSDIKSFIFTFTGCTLKVDGNSDLCYISNSTNVPQIFSLFNFFAERNFNYTGTRTLMVVGNGRTTFCSTLINYFIRLGKKVLFTEIDPSRGNIFPGALSTMMVDTQIDCIKGINIKNPLCFFYGSAEIENKELYDLQTTKLFEAIKTKGTEDFHILLAPNGSSTFYNSLIKRFGVEKVVCVGNERFFHSLEVVVDKLMITGGGYIKDNDINKSISRYFKGINNEFTPYSFNVKFHWKIVRLGEAYAAPESALPLGATRKVGTVEASEVEVIDNAVLAISEAKDMEGVPSLPVLGFVVVVNSEPFKILCTQPKLPKKSFLIQGTIRHMEY